MQGCRILLLTSFLFIVLPDAASQGISQQPPAYCGETMRYRLKYGIFSIGSATILMTEDSTGAGVLIRAEAQSDGLMKIFRNMHYYLVSCMDPVTALPIFSSCSLRDGRNNMSNELVFDHCSRPDSTIVYSRISGKQTVSKNIYDILTGFYHFRLYHIPEHPVTGEEVVIRTFHPDKPWDLKIRFAGEESLQTVNGQIQCYRCVPSTVVGNFFRHEDDMAVWFTKDKWHIPVKIRLNLRIGAIHGELAGYKHPAGETILNESPVTVASWPPSWYRYCLRD